jgi:DNA polymerase III delta prime subunit
VFIEQFSDNCRFILTCNFKNKIIEPLHSRCGVYEFNTSKKDLVGLADQFFKRAKSILTSEGVQFNDKEIAPYIVKHAPDWRRVINELQRYSVLGLSSGVSVNLDGSFESLFGFIKDKDFKKMRRWVADNVDLESSAVFRGIYDAMEDKVKPSSSPQLVLILADYQYKDAFVADHELNMVACLTEIMAGVEMK